MTKSSQLHYNYKVTKYDDNKREIHNKLYSQMKDILFDFPELTFANIKYLYNNFTAVRRSNKFRNMYVTKINPLPIYNDLPKLTKCSRCHENKNNVDTNDYLCKECFDEIEREIEKQANEELKEKCTTN